jgi:hypothetical protein
MSLGGYKMAELISISEIRLKTEISDEDLKKIAKKLHESTILRRQTCAKHSR